MQGGGGQGAGGTGTGSMANVFLPQGQPTADFNYMKTIQPLLDITNSGVESIGRYGSPAANAFGQATGIVDRGLTNNPYAGRAIGAADEANNYAVGQLFPQAHMGSTALFEAARGGMPYADTALQQGFDPQFQQLVDYTATNPYRGMAMDAAVQGARYGAEGAGAMQDMGRQIGGTIDPLIQSGFDPQSALFNRSQSQLMDQTNAINAMSGLSGTPYGASTMANAMGNFGIDWQNKQLGRQVQAAGAAGNAGTQAGNLYGQAPGLAQSSGAMPSNLEQSDISRVFAALGARNQAGLQGAQGYGSLLGSTGAGLAQGQGIGTQGAQTLSALGAAPYNTSAGMANNALQGLNQQTALGNNALDQGNKQLQNLLDYMTGGRSASMLSGQLGQQGFNQTSSGISGLMSGLGTVGQLAMTAPAAGSVAASL